MDDMNALERQIGTTLDRMGGPAPVFDPMAVARTAASSGQAGLWRIPDMFFATRLVGAAVIAALFGGLLALGIFSPFTQEPALVGTSPMASAELTSEPTDFTTPEPTPSRETLTVSQTDDADFVTITAALAAAEDGAAISVAPGTYEEVVRIDKSIELIGDAEADVRAAAPSVVIRAVGTVARDSEGELPSPLTVTGASATIRGVGVEEGREIAEGGRTAHFFPAIISIESGDTTLERVDAESLSAEPTAIVRAGEPGVTLRDSSIGEVWLDADEYDLTGNVIDGLWLIRGQGGPTDDELLPGVRSIASNEIEDLGGGGSDVSIRDNEIGGVELEGGSFILTGNTIGRATIRGRGSSLSMNAVGDTSIEGSGHRLEGNTLADVQVRRASGIEIVDNTITGGLSLAPDVTGIVRGNDIQSDRFGLAVTDGGVEISGNRICGQVQDLVGAGADATVIEANELCSSSGPGLWADERDFSFETIGPGIHRLVEDGAGHDPITIAEFDSLWGSGGQGFRDISMTRNGRVRVFITGDREDEAGDQVAFWYWTLGQPGEMLVAGEDADNAKIEPPLVWNDAGAWKKGVRAAAASGSGINRVKERLAASRDGTLWAIVNTDKGDRPARFNGRNWRVFPQQPKGARNTLRGPGAVDAQGRLWYPRPGHTGLGLGIFDGRSSLVLFRGQEVNGLTVDRDGRVWALVYGITMIEPSDLGAAIPPPGGADPALARSFPNRVDGVDVQPWTIAGDEWQLQFATKRGPKRGALDSFIEQTGFDVEELRFGYALIEHGRDSVSTIGSVRIPGTEMADTRDAALQLLADQIPGMEIEAIEVGGKQVERLTSSEMPGLYPRYRYAAGDTLWVVTAEEPVLGEILRKLP